MTSRPEDMRQAMADYVRTVHEAYLAQAAMQPPAVRGQMPLLRGPFTVIAAGVRNLHSTGPCGSTTRWCCRRWA
jgi:hypothetical protein